MSIISDELATFSDAILDELSATVYRNNWQNTGGTRTYADALAVFKNLLAELRSADKERLIDSMPVSLQKDLKSRLSNIRAFIQNITNGQPQVSNFTDDVDILHMSIWQGGFRYRGKKVLGYEDKYRRINALAVELEKVQALSAEAKKIVEELTSLQQKAQATAGQLEGNSTVASTYFDQIGSIRTNIAALDQAVHEQVRSVDSKLEDIDESVSTAEAKAQSAATNEKRLQDFIARVDESEEKLQESLKRANEGLVQNAEAVDQFKRDKTEELNLFHARLEGIEKQIKEKLEKATGVSLFETFEKRQKSMKGHIGWAVTAALTFAGIIGLSLLFLNTTSSTDIAWYIKLSFGIPLLFFGGFALQQYGKERRLKEEYAFKSAVSLSLTVYRDLVEKAVAVEMPDTERAKFTDFLIHNIGVIFDPPAERVFGSRRIGGPTDTRVIAALMKLLKDAKELVDAK